MDMKERNTAQDASGWDGSPAAKLTPLEVQQKEFRVARFGAGYRMREVDEFLDHVTDTLTGLIAENERLLRAGGARPAAAPAVTPPASDGDRAAVDAFLRTEKGFLQDLGTLVQSHAEELKTMVRSARSEATPARAVEAVDAEESDTDRPPADVEAASPPGTAAVISQAAVETSQEDEEEDDEEDEELPTVEPTTTAPAQEEEDTVAVAEPADGGEETMTGAIAEEPILLEQPEPARSGRSDDERDGSLRELFWGEE